MGQASICRRGASNDLRFDRIAKAFSLVFLVLLVACASPPQPRATEDFAIALDITAQNANESFAIVETAAVRADQEARAADYLVAGDVDLMPRAPMLPESVLQPRRLVLKGLVSYARLLADLSGGVRAKRLDAGFGELGKELVSLNAAFGNLGGGQTISPQTLAGGMQGVHALGQFLIEWQVHRTLPQAVEQMDPQIKAVAQLLTEDIGQPETRVDGKTVAGSGLRGLVSLTLDDLIKARELSLAAIAADRRVDRLGRYAAFQQTLAQTDVARSLDQALAALQISLTRMVRAHEALSAPNDPGSVATVEAFLLSAKSLGYRVDRLFGQL